MLLILHRMVTAEALDLGQQRVDARLRTIEPERLSLAGAGA
jgi:hypothetical protein